MMQSGLEISLSVFRKEIILDPAADGFPQVENLEVKAESVFAQTLNLLSLL